MKLAGKIAVVTGSSSGIGEACAREFAARGVTVILLARRRDRLEKLVSEIRDTGGAAAAYPVDLSDRVLTLRTCAEISSAHGAPDIIVNNAGAGSFRYIEETAPEEMEQMMAVPFFAAFNITRSFIEPMIKRESGHILNITSPSAFFPFPGATGYSTARWAMRGFSDSLSMDLRGTGVKCSLLTFGEVQSEYFANNPRSRERLPRISSLASSLTPSQCGMIIANAVEQNAGNLVRPITLQLAFWMAHFFPNLFNRVLAKSTPKRECHLR